MLAGAAARPADAIVFDLEDSVAPDEKANARERVSAILRAWPSDAPAPCVRINSPRRGEVEQDLAVVLAHPASSVLIPKVDRPEEIHGVLAAVGARDVMINIETPRALLRALDFADLAGVTALFLGGEDLTLELGMQRTAGSSELLSARFMLLCAARAAGIAAYDTICPDFRDLSVVEADSITAMQMGSTASSRFTRPSSRSSTASSRRLRPQWSRPHGLLRPTTTHWPAVMEPSRSTDR